MRDWIVDTPTGPLRLCCSRTARGKRASEQAARQAWLTVTYQLDNRDSRAIAGARALLRELGSSLPFVHDNQALDAAALAQLKREVASAYRGGAVVVEEAVPVAVRVRSTLAALGPAVEPVPAAPPPATEQEESLTWYEVQVVDELGQGIAGVELVFSSGGRSEPATTDGDGKAKVTDFPGSFATMRFAKEADVRQGLYDLWKQPRGEEWYEPATEEEERHTIIQVRRTKPLPSVSLVSEETHTIVLRPRVVQARLWGLWFDTSKCFLLPNARRSLTQIKELYDQNPQTDLLIVGHTDRAGDPSYNDPLSLERADAMAAYLRDEVDAWYQWYGTSKPQAKRWGSAEDEHMIEAIADDELAEIPPDRPLVEWYQEWWNERHEGETPLAVDNIAGEKTRKALIKEYMGLDDTTLPEDIRLTTHGCGENFPAHSTPDGVEDQENRRVEIFFFDNPIAPPDRPDAVLPPPPGPNSSSSSREYPEWVLRSKETYDFELGAWARLALRYEDESPAKNVEVKIRDATGVERSGATNDRGIAIIHGIRGAQWDLLSIEETSIVTNMS